MAKPPLPGSIVRREVIIRMRVKQADLARAMCLSRVRISQILNGREPITPNVALRLGKVTATEPTYWLQLQSRYDLYVSSKMLKGTMQELTLLPKAAAGERLQS